MSSKTILVSEALSRERRSAGTQHFGQLHTKQIPIKNMYFLSIFIVEEIKEPPLIRKIHKRR